MTFENTLAFAGSLDANDVLKDFRSKFYIPILHGREAIYFTGNSLGLQPRSTQEYVLDELEDWASFGVEGHFHARQPWFSYHEIFPSLLAPIAGALPDEIVVMNQLTVNLHLLMASFYKPTAAKFKIICEAKAFPSDQYAIESQVKFHGHDPAAAIIEVAPRPGEHCIRTEDILQTIQIHAAEAALVLFGGVNYYSGQVFDMEAITRAAHEQGIYCGFDLAHAAGNVELKLHDWHVDFACWCSYKYLNSGPGGVSGVFIHQQHHHTEWPRLAGWWGHDKTTRFEMEKGFKPIPTAEGWQLSNAPILSMAAHKAALDIFEEAGMERLLAKGKLLSDFLLFVLDDVNQATGNRYIEIITPRKEKEKGCQVSMLMPEKGRAVFETLTRNSVITDWREPNVIRVAPVPLYNSFTDIYHFGEIMKQVLLL
ncbi:MAG: kynureninase [Ferruginibacter sp.]